MRLLGNGFLALVMAMWGLTLGAPARADHPPALDSFVVGVPQLCDDVFNNPNSADCYPIEVGCGGFPVRRVSLRVHTPTTPIGHIVFGGGGKISDYYGNDASVPGFFARQTIANMVQSGYATYETKWEDPNGKLTFGHGKGWIALYCGYAAIAEWISNERAGRAVGQKV